MKRDRLLLVAFFLSGAAALGYEILWTRLLSLGLGSETLGILGTLAGFFGGLALGSFALHGTARRSRNPARLFALLEGIAAAYAVASPFLLHGLARRLPRFLGPAAGDNDTFLSLALSLGTALVVLLPATVPMGATLAALVEARRRALADPSEGRGLGRLYGANTLGATVGVLAAVHLVLPRLGMVAGAVVLAGLGLTAAGLALLWGRDHEAAPRPGDEGGTGEASPAALRPGMVHLILAGTGLAGVGLEVVGVQVLAQPLEDTVYTFAHILAVYLLGTAAGAWIYGRLAGRVARRGVAEVAAGLLVAHAGSVVLAAFLLRLAPGLLNGFAPQRSGVALRLGAELVLASFVFLVPTLLMGALASHLLAQVASRGVGRAYGFNTLGATLAPFLFGLGAIPLLGYAWAFYLAAVIYLLLYALAARRRGWGPVRTWGPAAAVAAALVLVAPTHLVLVPVEPGWREVARAETVMGLVRVTEREGAGLRRLQVNTYFRMGGGSAFGERRMGHIPLLLAPGARTALFLGTSTGGTLSAVRSFPLERVESVELVPEILAMMPLFEPINAGVYRDPRVRFHAADARRWVAASPDRFDVIVADLFHPAKDGAGTLYSREHFEAVREHLTEGGLFAQWIPLYQFDPQNLGTVVRTFLAVFPEVHSFLGIYNAETPALALLGRVPAPGRETLRVDLDRLAGKLREPVYGELLMQDPRDLLGAYMLDREALAAYAGPGPLNTDLVPRVLFDAPRSVYEDRHDLTYRSLLTLLPHRTLYPETLLAGDHPARLAAFRQEAAAFSQALGHYLQADVERYAAGPDTSVPDSSWERYVLAYRAAPEFEPAARVLAALTVEEPERARKIAHRMRARAGS